VVAGWRLGGGSRQPATEAENTLFVWREASGQASAE